MIEIKAKGDDRTFVRECEYCLTVFTYQLADTKKWKWASEPTGKFVECPVCGENIRATMEAYREDFSL